MLLFSLLISLVFNQEVITSKASYYHSKFEGRFTASGEVFSNNSLTAAHKTLKLGTYIEVTSLDTKKSVIVKVNDRGPYINGREVDLSRKAFSLIDNIDKGVIRITYRIVDKPIKSSKLTESEKTTKSKIVQSDKLVVKQIDKYLFGKRFKKFQNE